MKDKHISELGQVFTPLDVVIRMIGLRKNKGSILEPSSGRGAFLSHLESSAVGIELDVSLFKDKRVKGCDFFSYSIQNKFDTVIGNPPYVRFQDIKTKTKKLLPMDLFDERSNLYLFFISKSIDHLNNKGELILITPRDFLKATSARKLNKKLYEQGSMTHYYELGDAPIFDGVSPNCAIWRWEKGRKDRKMKTGGRFYSKNGQIYFYRNAGCGLGGYFDIKVGAVSGADDVFINQKRGCTDMVCSTTIKDNKTRKVIYNRMDKSLKPHKERLLRRRIRKFDESNWWEWGRKFCDRSGWRIYVNSKTRNKNPFFVSQTRAYDGSVLALFPKVKMDIEKAAHKLNKIDWGKLGFVCDGRFLFTQRSLENAPADIE